MMDISLLNIVLDDRLGDYLMSWNLNGLSSLSGIVLSLFHDWIELYGSVIKSVKLNIDVLSLNDRLDIGVVINFLSWSGDSFSSCSFLNDRLSGDGLSGLILRLSLLELNLFGVVHDRFLVDRLGVDFLRRSLENSVHGFFRKLSRSGLDWGVIDLSLSSVDLKLNVLSEYGGLIILLSDSGFSWDIDGH